MGYFIGIDNGVSGSIGIIPSCGASFTCKVPVKTVQDYVKKKAMVSRVDVEKLKDILGIVFEESVLYNANRGDNNMIVSIERPMVNPTRFKASQSALRCLEATLIVVESLCLPYQFLDSKEWQRAMLPSGVKGPDLKKASLDIGIRLFPHLEKEIVKQKDADGILIAEYTKRFLQGG